MTGQAERPLLSSSKVASMLGVSPSTILRAVRRGRLQAAGVTPAGFARLSLDDARQALKGNGQLSPGLLTSSEVADRLGISRSTVARAVKAGRVRPAVVTPGGHSRFTPDSVPHIAAGLGLSPPPAPALSPSPPAPPNPVKAARRTLSLEVAVRLLIGVAATAALIPFLALARGTVAAIRAGSAGLESVGLALALSALFFGAVFFLFSVKYYLATATMLLSSLLYSNGNGHNGHNGHNGNGHGSGNGHPHGLMRFVRRHNSNGNGNGHGNGNGNGNGHFDLGYEPFVSIHVATYNEKRVINRLLEGCAALEYGNYEVIVVDDSTDETAKILDTWRGRPRFKIIHRPNRDGFKGGALQVALQHMDARAEYVLVWDADVVPFADSIQSFLPHFFRAHGNGNGTGNGGDGHSKHPFEPRSEVAAVQSYQWHVLNKSESWLTEAVRAEYAGSYMIERPFQEFVGSLKMVAGTAYMIRADLLRRLGWGRSLTEDWELTLRLYALGYKVVYTPYAESPAECVATFSRLARQRMRWAEGHSYNVRRWFTEVVGSRHIGALEKVEFLFYSIYYLQAALFIVGSSGWFVAEVFLHAHVPDWTATLGWSLLASNLLSLPLMNLAGLLLEGAPAKDFVGVAGAVGTSFLLVPFQAYASLKGFLEKDEGPWYRTPKTGRVTDPIHHLRRLAWLRRWLLGPKSRARMRPQPTRMSGESASPRRRRPVGWVMVAALVLALAALGVGAVRAPVTQAAATNNLYLHHSSSGASIAFVNSASKTEVATANTLAVTYSSTAGNLLVAMIALGNTAGSGSVSSITDTAGNTWVQIDRPDCGNSTRSAMWYARNAAAITSLTFHLSQTILTAAYVLEFSGADRNAPLDVFNDGCNSTGTSTAPSSGAITPTATNDVIVGLVKAHATVTFSAGPSFTSGATNNQAQVESNTGAGNIEDLVTGYDLPGTAASQTYSGTFGAGAIWSSIIAAFRPDGYYLDGTSPPGATASTFAMTANGAKHVWATIPPTTNNQTIFSAATFQFNYWTTGAAGATSTVTVTFGWDIGANGVSDVGGGSCQNPSTIASHSFVLTLGSNLNTATFSPNSNKQVPSGSFFCVTLQVTAVSNGGLTLSYDASTATTNLVSSQTIYIPELILAFLGLALVAPATARLIRRRMGVKAS